MKVRYGIGITVAGFLADDVNRLAVQVERDNFRKRDMRTAHAKLNQALWQRSCRAHRVSAKPPQSIFLHRHRRAELHPSRIAVRLRRTLGINNHVSQRRFCVLREDALDARSTRRRWRPDEQSAIRPDRCNHVACARGKNEHARRDLGNCNSLLRPYRTAAQTEREKPEHQYQGTIAVASPAASHWLSVDRAR